MGIGLGIGLILWDTIIKKHLEKKRPKKKWKWIDHVPTIFGITMIVTASLEKLSSGSEAAVTEQEMAVLVKKLEPRTISPQLAERMRPYLDKIAEAQSSGKWKTAFWLIALDYEARQFRDEFQKLCRERGIRCQAVSDSIYFPLPVGVTVVMHPDYNDEASAAVEMFEAGGFNVQRRGAEILDENTPLRPDADQYIIFGPKN